MGEVIKYLQNLEISQIISVITATAVLMLFLVFSSIFAYLLVKIFQKNVSKEEIKKQSLYKTIRLFMYLLGIYSALKILHLPIEANYYIDKTFKVILIWTAAGIISGIVELREIILAKLKYKGLDDKEKNVATIVSKITKFILYTVAIYLSLKEFGYDLGGLATGLGITGAVVALATQDIMKQLFAGFTIFADKPFEIGDWVQIGDVDGTVQSISLRTTKLKTLQDTIVTVENNTVINNPVTNWGKIQKRLYRPNIKLALETDETTIEKVMSRIRFILKYDKEIIKDSVIVQLSSIDQNCVNINIYLETTVTKYFDYLKFCSRINLTILNILETQGVKLAYPGQNIYVKENIPLESIKSLPEDVRKVVKPKRIKK